MELANVGLDDARNTNYFSDKENELTFFSPFKQDNEQEVKAKCLVEKSRDSIEEDLGGDKCQEPLESKGEASEDDKNQDRP